MSNPRATDLYDVNARLDAEVIALDAKIPSFTLFRDIGLEPRKTWLVHEFLGEGELSCVFGPPGSGKSVLAGDLAATLAAGRDWFGRRVQFGSVLYVALERAALVKRRLAAFRNYHGVEDIPLAVLSGQYDLRSSREGAERIIDHAKRLADITEVPLSLVFIDTVSRALAGGDENSPKDMGALVGNLALIQERASAHVSALHHIPADGSQRLRGHGALLGACDTTIKVESLNDYRSATVDKVNDGPEGERVTFKLESVELHYDPDTENRTTAPVVIPVEASALSAPKGPNLTANQRSMLNILEEAGRGGLSQEEWFELARARGIGKNRIATLYDLRKALKDKGLVYEFNGQWYLSN
ncbi:MAG: AAA family ATPase [Methyloceanibacter sp.]